jgi:hypothetical protein
VEEAMNGYLRQILTISTTPRELREIADKMEEKWPMLRTGDSTVVAERFMGDNVTVAFSVDQAAYTRDLAKVKL